MKYIAQFILFKLRSKDFWAFVLGSLAMYAGWMLRAQMKDSVWKSFNQGHNYK